MALLSLLAPRAALGRSTLVYAIPPGWVDLSPGVRNPKLGGLTPAIVTDATSGHFELYALDRRYRQAFEPRLFAESFEHDAPMTAIFLDTYTEGAMKQLTSAKVSTTVLQKKLITLGGAPSGRLLLENRSSGPPWRQLVYLIPNGDRMVSLSFLGAASSWEKELPVFEASAKAITGIVPASYKKLRAQALAGVRQSPKVSAVPRGASPLTFSLPPGMTDVTAKDFDPELAEEVRRKNFAAYAIGGDGETFHAVLQEGSLFPTDDLVDKLAERLEMSSAMCGRSIKTTERSFAAIGSVRAVRLVFDLEGTGGPLRGVWYAIPSGPRFAELTYLSPAAFFPRLLPGFDEAALATTGAATPVRPVGPTTRSRLAILAGGLAVAITLLAALIGWVSRPSTKRKLSIREIEQIVRVIRAQEISRDPPKT